MFSLGRFFHVWHPARMARTKDDSDLKSRSSRAKLAKRKAPYWMPMEKGRRLGYYKGAKGGNWLAWFYDPTADPPTIQKSLGAADDHSDPDGKMVLSFSQAQEAAREWFKVAYHEATGDRVSTGAYTVKDAIQAYVDDRKKNEAKSANRIDGDLQRHVIPHLGDVELRKLTQKRLEDWQAKVAASPTWRAGVEGKAPESEEETRARRESTNRIWKNFKAALNLARRDRRIGTDAGWRDVKPFKGTKVARLRFLSIPDQQRLVNAAQAEDFRRLLQAGLFTGAREGEVARLQARDFDPAHRTVFIEKSKSGRARHVHLPPEAGIFFQECTAGLEPETVIFPRTFYDRKQKAPSGKWSRSEIGRMMKDVCETASLEPLVFHELRHTCASTWINAGMSLYFVAQQLGHRDTRMVEEYYGHLCQHAKADAVDRFSPLLGIYTPQGIASIEIKHA